MRRPERGTSSNGLDTSASIPTPAPGEMVFNRTVTLKDTWARIETAQLTCSRQSFSMPAECWSIRTGPASAMRSPSQRRPRRSGGARPRRTVCQETDRRPPDDHCDQRRGPRLAVFQSDLRAGRCAAGAGGRRRRSTSCTPTTRRQTSGSSCPPSRAAASRHSVSAA